MVAGLFVLLTAALTYPLSIRPHDTVIANDPDNQLFIWTLAWNVHALATAPLRVFDANIFYPQPLTLAYSENLLGSAPFAAPVIWLTGNPVLAMNVVALLSCALCGVGAYVLARRLGLGTGAAIVCGIVFAFSPARFFRTSQLHLGPVQWIPFALASLHTYFDHGRARDLRLALAFFTLQAATTGHGAVFAAVAMGLLGLWTFALGTPIAPRRRLRDAGLPGLVLLLLSVALFVPYRVVQVEMGLRRYLQNWAAAPESFLASPTTLHSAVLSALAPHVNEVAHAYLFPGYVVLALTLAALPWRWGAAAPLRRLRERLRTSRQARHAVFYALLTIVCVLLAAGPPVSLWPLVYWLPGFNFIRGPSRFMILGVLGLAVLAGLGLQRLASRCPGGRSTALVVAVSALLVAEFSAVPLRVVPFRVRIPAADRWLARQPKPFAVAEFPVGISPRYHTGYMLHAMAHWQKTVHGYSGIRAPLHDELYDRMREFPDATSLEALATLGVTYVVVHADMYPPEEWTEVERRLPALAGWLTPVYTSGAGTVYTLHRPRN